ncbi:hypothetical protein [Marinomonas aquiplantarum]|uniref:Uncharacterized protein n=1 Tax=Marinomonas aquiplantarum TaxID=491951 RepID=A0A366CXU1_9GAMM|nr:hypothetical protein [Marinomonas aquiplantarum]RBO82657.1 hypothetical protein DFP76_105124 [Marinomonas aquiplantarum]
MNVVEHSPAAWFLLEQDDEYYIDVNCSSGLVGFSVLVQLNGSEKTNYKNQGVEFINGLAEVIADKAELNHPRNIKNNELLNIVHESIMSWKQLQT